MDQSPVSIYRAANSAEAHLISELLQAEGIESQIAGENQAYAGLSTVMPIEVLVPLEMREKALALIAAQHETRGEAPTDAVVPGETEFTAPERLSLRENWLEAAVVVSILFWFYFQAIATFVWPDRYAAYVGSIEDNLQYLVQDMPIILIFLFIIQHSGKTWAEFGLVRPRLLIDVPLAGCVWMLDMTLWILLSGLLPAYLWPEAAEDITRNHWGGHLLMMSTTLVAAFMEELLLRCYLITRLEQVYRSKTLCVVLSSAVFAGYHMYLGWPGVIDAFIGGVLYGVIFCLVRSIWPVTFAHAMYNLTMYWISQAGWEKV